MSTYAFDLDGTLCSQGGNYQNAQPYEKRINFVNELYNQGHTIKIFTARGMNSMNGDIQQCYEKYFTLTSKQLKNWNVKYHELILGKPSYDLIIDDKAINSETYFEVIDI